MTKSQVIALVLAVGLGLAVLELVRRRRLSEEYSVLWLAATLGIAAVGLWTGLLHAITRLMGAVYDTSVVFFGGIMFALTLSLVLSVRLTRLTRESRRLAQEVALLRAAVAEAASPLRGPAVGTPPRSAAGEAASPGHGPAVETPPPPRASEDAG